MDSDIAAEGARDGDKDAIEASPKGSVGRLQTSARALIRETEVPLAESHSAINGSRSQEILQILRAELAEIGQYRSRTSSQENHQIRFTQRASKIKKHLTHEQLQIEYICHCTAFVIVGECVINTGKVGQKRAIWGARLEATNLS